MVIKINRKYKEIYEDNKTVVPALINGWGHDGYAQDDVATIEIVELDEPLIIVEEEERRIVVTDILFWYNDVNDTVSHFVGLGSQRMGKDIYLACLHITLADSYPAADFVRRLPAAEVKDFWPQFIEL